MTLVLSFSAKSTKMSANGKNGKEQALRINYQLSLPAASLLFRTTQFNEWLEEYCSDWKKRENNIINKKRRKSLLLTAFH